MPDELPEDEKYLYLTTTGRLSGEARQIEIWYVEIDSKYYLLAEKFLEANWVRNIQQNPKVRVSVRGKEFSGLGRILDPQSDPELWQAAQDLCAEKYGWGDGLPVEIVPDKN